MDCRPSVGDGASVQALRRSQRTAEPGSIFHGDDAARERCPDPAGEGVVRGRCVAYSMNDCRIRLCLDARARLARDQRRLRLFFAHRRASVRRLFRRCGKRPIFQPRSHSFCRRHRPAVRAERKRGLTPFIMHLTNGRSMDLIWDNYGNRTGCCHASSGFVYPKTTWSRSGMRHKN
jgi:hypothetical protein